MKAWLRKDGRKGIRNVVVVGYLVECAHHVAKTIVNKADSPDVQLIGFPGCYPNDYALKIMKAICTHPNVGGAVLLSLGCEGFNREQLSETIADSGRPVETLVIQQNGGTRSTIEKGLQAVADIKTKISHAEKVDMAIDELIIGTICGGSDGTSGISGNPGVGYCFDRLVEENAACIFEETGELIGCEQVMIERAATPELAREIDDCLLKAAHYYEVLGYGSFAPGNAEGGLTTQEEKSMGAYCKSGDSQIVGLLKPGDIPPTGGLYLLDVVPDGEVRFGFPNISDNAEIVELIACGCHITLFTTGRGSVVGSAISPVIKICANPETYKNLSEDMDVNAGKVLEGSATPQDIGDEIYQLIMDVAAGKLSKSEELGHQEFILTYKYFEPVGPACLPTATHR
ncbi:UxaA family hydrolase [Pseudoteredinibacter isoporae]|uniref:Altronate hydrolase n=1 Tax=Pseudoteredinibacter isoporae TaxID=570281 RepID=A0A7X0JVJ6_9GAMM|nr:UxaA family hydrolase [Pseudoteredinibacter isoporae]MBB6522584.1 altronate hydrolase [Pseudoteredinibacter isoporae]NHO88114.1 UxaA family hydrolase [Pseudoteredinibacter isoporae]NIB23555.1 UxaA family hydrolase [Pseudoteredinibacter isoporae]